MQMVQELNLETWVQSSMTSLNEYDEENQKWQGGRKRCGKRCTLEEHQVPLFG